MYRLWKDINPTETWEEGYWDEILPQQLKIMPAVKVGLKGKSDPEVAPIVSGVVVSATGKAELVNSPVTLASLTTLATDGPVLLTEEVQAKEAWLAKRTTRRNHFKTMRRDLKRYATYANTVYMGDKELLQAVGLDVVEIGPLLGVLPGPQNIRSAPGTLDGSIDVAWNYTTGRDFYELQCAESAGGPWSEAYKGSASRASCQNLVSGKEYFFRVRAFNAAGPGGWSNITKRRAS